MELQAYKVSNISFTHERQRQIDLPEGYSTECDFEAMQLQGELKGDLHSGALPCHSGLNASFCDDQVVGKPRLPTL